MKDNKRKQVRDNERQREDTQRHLLCMYPPPPSTLCRISGWPKSLAERPSPISAAASKASPPTCSQELKPSRRPGRRAGAALRKGELHVETHPHRPHKPGYGILPAEHKRGTAVPRDPPKKTSGCRGLGCGAFEVLDAHPGGRGGGMGIGRSGLARVKSRVWKFKLHHGTAPETPPVQMRNRFPFSSERTTRVIPGQPRVLGRRTARGAIRIPRDWPHLADWSSFGDWSRLGDWSPFSD